MGRHHGSRHSGSHHRSSSHRSSSHRSRSHHHHSSSGRRYNSNYAEPGYQSPEQHGTKPLCPTGEYRELWYDEPSGSYNYVYHGYSYIENAVDAHVKEGKKPFLSHTNPSGLIYAVIFLIIFAFRNFTYEILIVPFEYISMSDEAFAFIDDFIFILQFLIIPLPVFYAYLRSKKITSFKFELVREAVEYYKTQEEYAKLQREAAREVSARPEICRSCGADLIHFTGRNCPFCDAVIEIYESADQAGLSGSTGTNSSENTDDEMLSVEPPQNIDL